MPMGIFHQFPTNHYYWRITSSFLLLVSSSSSSSTTTCITSPFLLHHHHRGGGGASSTTATFITTTSKRRNSITTSTKDNSRAVSLQQNNILKMSSSSSQQQQQQQNNIFFPTVSEFLKSTKKKATTTTTTTTTTTSEEGLEQPNTNIIKNNNHIAIGNPAGDADSIVSSIAISYINNYTPIISIPIQDLQSLRPETKYLLSLAGISDISKDYFIGIDDDDDVFEKLLKNHNKDISVTLVDHNKLALIKQPSSWKVIEIFDHHIDEMEHTDTCPPSSIKSDDDDDDDESSSSGSSISRRIIAFDSNESKALVASTCTLIVEHFLSKYPATTTTNFPPTLAILLLGVILLDSINMLPKAGKVTQRDIKAVEYLQTNTDWSELNLPSELLLETNNSKNNQNQKQQPNLTKLFDTLQNQKFHPNFWNSLTIKQAIKLDYKSFTLGTTTFGMSSILQTKEDFFGQKENHATALRKELDDKSIGLLVLMFCDFSDGTPRRQLAWICRNKELSQSLLKFLEEEDGTLQLKDTVVMSDTDDDYVIVQMNQGNTKASRKQVAPIIMEFFKKQEMQL